MRWLTLWICCSLLLACSDDSSVTAEEFISQYAAEYCGYLSFCCDANEQSFNSRGSCEAAMVSRVKDLLAFQDQGAAFAAFNGEAAKGCLDRLRGRGCDDPVLLRGCLDQVTTAAHKKNEECRYSAECDSFYCVQSKAGEKGSCGAQADIGGSCSGHDSGCPSGTFCSGLRQCTRQKKGGDSCSRAEQCESFICHRTDRICVTPSRSPICTG